jgi:hypothetical protein
MVVLFFSDPVDWLCASYKLKMKVLPSKKAST